MKIHVYVVNLQNEEGKWFTLPMDADKLTEEMEEFAKEVDYKIYDYEAPFYIDEFTNIYELNDQLNELEIAGKHLEEDEMEALLEWVDDLDEAISWLKEGRVRFYDTGVGDPDWSDLAELLVYDYGYMDVPDYLKDYMDYEQIGRDLWAMGNWYLSKNGIAVEKIR